MTDEAVWRKRFFLFMFVRLSGMLVFFLGVAIAMTDLVTPGGAKVLGVVVALVGLTEALVVSRLLKRKWSEPAP